MTPALPPADLAAYRVAQRPWAAGLGHIRAVVRVAGPARVVRVTIPWRRRDADFLRKAIQVVRLSPEEPVANVARLRVDLDSGTLAFGPVPAAGEYGVYWLPYTPQNVCGGYGGDYLPWADPKDAAWAASASGDAQEGELVAIESRMPFDAVEPMEVRATAAETEAFVAAHDRPYLVFAEDRTLPIRMPEALPMRWLKYGPSSEFRGSACLNEYYALQLGLFAARQGLSNVRVEFSDLGLAGGGQSIPSSALECINTDGLDTYGKPMAKRVDVARGRVQPLWIGVDVPRDAVPGNYVGALTVTADGVAPTTIPFTLTVEPKLLEDRGDGETWRHSRLRWLNSATGIDDAPVAPYTPIGVKGSTLSVLGRTVQVGPDGMPSAIRAGSRGILSDPLRIVADGAEAARPAALRFLRKEAGVVTWSGESRAADHKLTVDGRLEFDGHLLIRATLTADRALDLRDVRLELPFAREAATYFMGAGRKGGLRPASYDWKWTGPFDSFWMGDVWGGIHCELRGGTYNGPMMNLYHPAPPASWSNGGKGGVRVGDPASGAAVAAYTGPRTLQAGEALTLEFALIITPVKQLDTATHFRERYYHNAPQPGPTEEAVKAGVNVINVHHANDVNQYINYPFVTPEGMKRFVDEWHARNMKVKWYYTVRELTNHVTELWALRSLGTEILAGGGGGGFPWLREHLVTDYAPQWFQPFEDGTACSAILTSGESRWYNYYIEGLDWLVRNMGIDGLYLDDVTYDRHILKRMRKVMQAARPGCLLDLHSNTGFSIGPANQYMEFFPYVDRLWFGESFRYNEEDPAYWLVEASGIPFGLMGDMLQDGGNRWRGMVYGMTVRLPWVSETNHADPKPVWKVWDAFGIDQAQMLGYWDAACPVRTSSKEVLATVYRRKGKALIALASWATAKVDVTLIIDWKALGISPAKAVISAPAVEDFQPARSFAAGDAVPVEPLKGWLLLIEER
ncbi:MAG: DUF6067 family protein [Armatimonadetes bacterium]|nr:DUF6067 family protein [Armatimonadota bacterium]